MVKGKKKESLGKKVLGFCDFLNERAWVLENK